MSYPLDKSMEDLTDEELRGLLSRVRGSRMKAKMNSPARKETRKKETAAKTKLKKLMAKLTPEQIEALQKEIS